MPTPDGQTLLGAQDLWKTNKDGGQPVTAVFVSDVSGSMQGSRIQALKRALGVAINQIGDAHFGGMVLFSDDVTQVLEIQQFDIEHQRRFVAAVEDMSLGGESHVRGLKGLSPNPARQVM